MAAAMGVWKEGDLRGEAPARLADEVEKVFLGLGMPIRLSQLGIPKESLACILDNSMKNYNSDPKREFIREKGLLGEVLEATW